MIRILEKDIAQLKESASTSTPHASPQQERLHQEQIEILKTGQLFSPNSAFCKNNKKKCVRHCLQYTFLAHSKLTIQIWSSLFGEFCAENKGLESQVATLKRQLARLEDPDKGKDGLEEERAKLVVARLKLEADTKNRYTIFNTHKIAAYFS